MTARTIGRGLALICSALLLEVAMAASGNEQPGLPRAASAKPPFYSDKFDLLMYLDEAGQRHPVRSVEEWPKRRAHIVAGMELVMGPFPDASRKVPLNIVEVDVEKLPGVTRKKITYATEAGDRVPAYILLPDDLTAPAPAMLCLHGTGSHDGKTTQPGGYALQLALRGYVTISPDFPTFGGNAADPAKLGYASGTMKGIWDNMRAVDVLQSLPQVDPSRIGCVGNSLGGHNTLFVSVFDPRIKVIICSSGFDSFLDYLNGNLGGWCQNCYMPRIETVYGKEPKALPFDFPEVLAALAPRPLFINAPQNDGNFKMASVDKCVQAALPVYKLFGAEANVKLLHPDAPHGFQPDSRTQAFDFLDGVFKHVSRKVEGNP